MPNPVVHYPQQKLHFLALAKVACGSSVRFETKKIKNKGEKPEETKDLSLLLHYDLIISHSSMESDQDSSFKQKIKSSICFSCCFRSESMSPDDQPRLIRSSSSWLRSKASELPEIKDKFHGFISRISSRRRTNSTDFRYDPLSYALNFDEGPEDYDDEEYLARNFSSRLAPSPPSTAMAVRVSREIDCK